MSIVNNDSVKPQKTPAQKRQTKMALMTIGLVVTAIVIAYYVLLPKNSRFVLSDYQSNVVLKQDFEKTVQATGTTQIPIQMIVPNPQEGYVLTVNVVVGDFVKIDDVLAVFSVPLLDETIEDLQFELKREKRELQRLILEQSISIEDTQEKIRLLKQDINDAQAEVTKYKKLVNINLSRLTQLEDKQAFLEDIQYSLKSTKTSLSRTEQLQVIDLAEKNDDITSIQTRLNRALQDKEDTRIKSPMSGEVIDMDSQLGVTGSAMDANVELFIIADQTSVVFQLELSEEYSSTVNIGDSLNVSINSSWVVSNIISIGKIAQGVVLFALGEVGIFQSPFYL
ncbi:MAG: hypothetical protein HRU38_15605 [Saccharospirillaceae bacterium]|nr:hypothetical protein [Saccharospirillaceae bacterium]